MSSGNTAAGFPANFEEASTPEQLAAVLTEYREALGARAADMGGVETMRAYSILSDALIRRIWSMSLEESEVEIGSSGRRRASRSIAIAAVGGYGRQEMCPHSDVDVAFLAAAEEDDEVDVVVKRAFRIMMDVLDLAQLKVGYSYRRVDEVQGLELETQTALLDARLICGSATVFNTFEIALKAAISPADFVVGHIRSRRGAGPKDGTPFVVEPDVKEGHGGLRDLHTARWLAQVSFGLTAEAVWDGLRARGILVDWEMEEIKTATEFMSKTRNTLHLLAGRGLDVLGAERHVQVASAMGLDCPDTFISTYYALAHRLWRIYQKVAAACLKADLEIEPGIISRDGRLRILDKGILARDKSALIRAFKYAQCYSLSVDLETSDLIASAATHYKLNSDSSRTLVEILSRPGAAAMLRTMADLGVLQAVVPDFAELMYLVPGDSAHQFTVGEHSLRAVEELEKLLGEPNEQFADVFSRIQNFEVLFLATLLHDIGKLDGIGRHAKTGAKRAAEYAASLGMSEDFCCKVEFLVRNHLLMSETARLRDLHQRKTVQDFVRIVSDPQLLDMLFLLTVADSRSVGSRHWSQVQTRFLLELHERAYAAIRSPESMSADIERHRARVRRELCLANLPADEVEEHCASMPASYLLNMPPEELAAHIGYVRSVRTGTPVVDVRDERAGEYTELTVVAFDRPALLSDIAGVLSAMNIDIHAAQIFTRHSSDEIAIDILYIDYEGRQLTEIKKWQVEAELANVLSGTVEVNALLRRWGKKPLENVEELSVRVLENLSDHETVLEIRGEDRPGLLHYLTRKIAEHGLNIHSARVATWGHEARDAFYVTNGGGKMLSEEEAEKFAYMLRE